MKKTILTKVLCLAQITVLSTASSILPLIGEIAPAQAQAAPNCFTLSTWTSTNSAKVPGLRIIRKHARIINGCGRTFRVKVIWAYAPDSSCKSIPAGGTFESRAAGRFARFDGLQAC
ncbi:MAG: hypothetical protein KME10_28030 [Plectolyngbya sp. WJT66-NPBG17]|jgi:hypothetical protein|nr:hypothetical protein [Plectolyngbya sp. WJT66-NPBG17]